MGSAASRVCCSASIRKKHKSAYRKKKPSFFAFFAYESTSRYNIIRWEKHDYVRVEFSLRKKPAEKPSHKVFPFSASVCARDTRWRRDNFKVVKKRKTRWENIEIYALFLGCFFFSASTTVASPTYNVGDIKTLSLVLVVETSTEHGLPTRIKKKYERKFSNPVAKT